MSLNELMGGNQKLRKVHINEIRLNKQNKYELVEIEALAETIKTEGQMENGVAYIEELEDGKKYTLIGGHRRHQAISLLYSKNESDGMMDIKVITKPSTLEEEEMLIVQDNNQRQKSKQERLGEIEVALKYFDSLEEDKKPSFTSSYKKRDYIGEKVGISGRQAQKYMNLLDEKKKKEPNKKIYNKENVCKELNTIASKLKSLLEKMEKNNIDIKFKDKPISDAIKIELDRVDTIKFYIENINN